MRQAESTKPESMRSRTIRGSSWIIAGRILRLPTNVIVTATLARLLLPGDFGTVAFVTTLTSFATVIFDGSIGINILRRPELKEGELGTSLAVNLAVGVILTAGVIVGAGPLERSLHMPHLAETLTAIGFTLPCTAGASVFNALLQRHNNFKSLVLASLTSQLIYGAVSITLAAMGFGTWSLAIGLICSIVWETSMNALSARRFMEWQFRGQLLRQIAVDGSTFTLVRLLGWGSGAYDKFAAGLLGAGELGFYSRASSLFVIANQAVGTGLMRALLSSFARIAGDRERMGRGYLRVVELMLLVSTTVALNIILFAPAVVRILLGPNWDRVATPLRFLFVAFIARSLSAASEALTATVASNRQNIGRQAVQFALVAAFVTAGSRYGISGIAGGYAMAVWLMHFINLFAARRWVRLRLSAIALVHLRPLCLLTPATVVTLAYMHLAPISSVSFRSVGGGMTFVSSALLTIFALPHHWLARDLVEARRLLPSRLKALLSFRTAD